VPLKKQGVPPGTLVEIPKDDIVDGYALNAIAKIADTIRILFTLSVIPRQEILSFRFFLEMGP
jgi:hypothetical protein